MLEQLVYTRGKPRIDLCKGGELIPTDGFGVTDLSEGLLPLLDSAEKKDFVNTRAARRNGSKERIVGLFNSYEYSRVDDGTYILSYEFSRPYSPDLSVPEGSRMSGIFVKQCLVGAPAGYPYEWIGADVWTAWRIPDAEYRRNSLPPPLPAVSEVPSGGSILPEDIDGFLADGRASCAEAALCFLLRQFALPEEKRRVLLIRDTPDRVALWTAAFQRALSPEMARELTFATNRSELNIQPEPALFSYSSRTGPDGRPVSTRRPYCMIVGYHPKDTTCPSPSAAENTRYVLLNGADRTLYFRPEMTGEEAAFISSALRCEPSARRFFSRPYRRLPLEKAASALPRLFSADRWLRGEAGNETYEDVLGHLQSLSEAGMTDAVELVQELSDRALETLTAHLETDEKRNWTLAALCEPLLQRGGRWEESVEQLQTWLTRPLFASGNASRLIALERAADGGGLPPCMDNVQDALFRSQQLVEMTALIEENRLGNDAAAVLVRMFLRRLSAHSISEEKLLENRPSMDFLQAVLLSLSDAPEVLRGVLSRITPWESVMKTLAIRVTGELGRRDEQVRSGWLETIFTIRGYDPMSLYQQLLDSGEMEPAVMESLLVKVVEQPDSDLNTALSAFRQLMRSDVAVDGTEFFRAVIRRTTLRDLKYRIDVIRNLNLPKRTQRILLKDLDASVSYPDKQTDTSAVLQAMWSWGRALKGDVPCVSTAAELYRFCTDVMRARSAADALQITGDMKSLAPHLHPDGRYYQSDCFRRMVLRAREMRSIKLHAAVLSMFDEAPIDHAKYAEAYISILLAEEEAAPALFRLGGRREFPGLDNAVILMQAAKELKGSRGEAERRTGALVEQYTAYALLSRGRKQLERDLRAYEKTRNPAAADLLRSLVAYWDRGTDRGR